MTEGNLEAPYYLQNQNDFEHLETEMSILPPELKGNYIKLEHTVSNAFNEIFGPYLNGQQRNYMGGVQAVFTDHNTAQEFSKQWDKGIVSIDMQDQVLTEKSITAIIPVLKRELLYMKLGLQKEKS